MGYSVRVSFRQTRTDLPSGDGLPFIRSGRHGSKGTAVCALQIRSRWLARFIAAYEQSLAIGKPVCHLVVELGPRHVPHVSRARGQKHELLRFAGNDCRYPFAIRRNALGNAITQANGRGTVRIAHVRGIPRSAGIALFGEENPLAVGRDRHWQGPVLPTEIGFGFLAGRQSRNTTTPVLPDP